MPIERLEQRVAQACELIAAIREENLRLQKEVSVLRNRNETLERATRASQAKITELVAACERVQ